MKQLFNQISTQIKHKIQKVERVINQRQGDGSAPSSICEVKLRQANQFKDIGNQSLMAGLVEEAIMYYTKSIDLNPFNHIVYTNRSTAFKRQKELELMYADAQRAVELDPAYFKAHLRLGEACVEMGKLSKYQSTEMIDRGIKHIGKAQSICWNMQSSDPKYEQKALFEKELNKQLLRARKIRWFKQQELEQIEKEVILQEMRSLLNIDEIKTEQANNAKVLSDDASPLIDRIDLDGDALQDKPDDKAGNLASRTVDPLETPDGTALSLSPAQMQQQNEICIIIYQKVARQFNLEQAEKKRKELEVPDYLLCSITDELMDEPVILESGFTYEKSQIVRHFERNGNFDPITRQEVDPKVLIENKHIKHATADFLVRHPWAFERVYGETIDKIHM